MGTLEQMVAQYENATVLDFQQLFFEKNHYFYDPDHLNKAGAQEFSTKLEQSLIAGESTSGSEKNCRLSAQSVGQGLIS